MLKPYRVELASVTADENSIRVLLRELGPNYRLDTSGRLLYEKHFLTDIGPGEFLLIAIPLMTLLGAFMKGFGNKLGEQSAEAVGKLFSDWIKRTHKVLNKEAPAYGGHMGVFVYDKKKALKTTLPADLPPGAYGELVAIGKSRKKSKRNQSVANIWYDDGSWHVGL